MLEQYYVRPDSVDRIRASWIGAAIEQYVRWLTDRGHARSTVVRRVPILLRFGEFAFTGGARTLEELPAQVAPFVDDGARARAGRPSARQDWVNLSRTTAEQMLRLVLPGASVEHSSHDADRDPFKAAVPGFFPYLRSERGLSERSLIHFRGQLRRFETYLGRIELIDLADLSPVVLSGFVTESSRHYCKSSLKVVCSDLRVFLRFLHREGLTPRNLSRAVGAPQVYRLADIPRSVSWDEVRRVLESVERRTVCGKRDYAILLLHVTYGFRAREVAALTLDDIDWRRDRLRVPERKAGHSTTYPLSPQVGEAILAYLQGGRPGIPDRHLFLSAVVPYRPMTFESVSLRSSHYLHKAEISAPRLGSHTFRHTCVQRLVDADFPLKVIGDFVGHRSAASTEIYSKVAIEALREVALGDGEDVL